MDREVPTSRATLHPQDSDKRLVYREQEEGMALWYKIPKSQYPSIRNRARIQAERMLQGPSPPHSPAPYGAPQGHLLASLLAFTEALDVPTLAHTYNV